MPQVKFLLSKEPKAAIEYLYQKKLLASKVFNKELHDSALARATTISRLSSLEITKDIYDSMAKAKEEGKAFGQWKKELVSELERKGWVVGHDKAISRGIDGKLLADPKTGEYFGTPRRLNTIYRTNMQQAYAAARYQRYMDNVDNRPYWQYSAVGDQRTRPAHQALHGKIYRYDDPFWTTFYPPNGFNCRCTVIALSDRDLKRRGIDKVGSSESLLVKTQYPKDKQGNQQETIGFKLPDGAIRVADKGFDYNVGQSHLAHLGKLMLDKGVDAPPHLAAVAINHTFKQNNLVKAITDKFTQVVADVKSNIEQGKAYPRGELWHIGSLLPQIVLSLEKEGFELQSAIISIRDNEIYHLFRTNKSKRPFKGEIIDKRLSEEFISALPKYLLKPKAVIQDLQQKEPTLLYIYDTPDGKVVIKLNYELKTNKKETIRTNLIVSGETILDITTLKSKAYKLLWGEL